MATSQNGWPVLVNSSRKLYTWNVPGQSKSRLRLRNGSAGFLLVHWATFFDDQVEDLDEPVMDDWGYAYRPVAGYSSGYSNHASGTAMDLNATDHPLGQDNTFSDAEEAKIHKVLDKYEGCIRWGGDYRGRKDEMHFEIDKPLARVEDVARKLLDSQRGQMVLAENPGQKKVILS